MYLESPDLTLKKWEFMTNQYFWGNDQPFLKGQGDSRYLIFQKETGLFFLTCPTFWLKVEKKFRTRI